MTKEELAKKLEIILQNVKISDAELQKMSDNGESDLIKLQTIIDETNSIFQKLSNKDIENG